MIDAEGYRANIAIIIMNRQRKVFWGKRIYQKSWQFPQGGLQEGETALAAMYRELEEEVGLQPTDIEVVSVTPGWFKYKLPEKYIRKSSPHCIGQKQKWFLVRLISDDDAIQLDRDVTPEFDAWRWVSYWYPLSQVIDFKKQVYRRALEKFQRYALNKNHRYKSHRHHKHNKVDSTQHE